MEAHTRRDLTVSGVMSGQGGIYRSVFVNGYGKLRGDLDCIDFRCSGKATVQGSVKSEKTEIQGFVFIEGNCGAKRVQVNGKTTVGGNLTGEDVNVDGYLSVKGSCDAEVFRARGGFRVKGLLNAGTIDIQLHGRCRVKEIGGGTIKIRKPYGASPFQKLIQSFLPKFDQLTADTIEGDDIHLEYTRAKIVRGSKVTIGPGCEIDMVEYMGHFEQDESAKVGESRKV